MASFQFFLIGMAHAPIVEIDQSDISSLTEFLARRRFVSGKAADGDGCDFDREIAIQVSRIQMICEVPA